MNNGQLPPMLGGPINNPTKSGNQYKTVSFVKSYIMEFLAHVFALVISPRLPLWWQLSLCTRRRWTSPNSVSAVYHNKIKKFSFVPKNMRKYKTAVCRYYIRDGICLYGENCFFIHPTPSVQPRALRKILQQPSEPLLFTPKLNEDYAILSRKFKETQKTEVGSKEYMELLEDAMKAIKRLELAEKEMSGLKRNAADVDSPTRSNSMEK